MTERPVGRKSFGDWPAGWDAHRRAQLERWMAATPTQRLAWLEEMIALAWKSGALPRREQGPDPG